MVVWFFEFLWLLWILTSSEARTTHSGTIQGFYLFTFLFCAVHFDEYILFRGFERLMFVSNWLHQLLTELPTLARTAAVVLQDFPMKWSRLNHETLNQNLKWRPTMKGKISRWILSEQFPTSSQAKVPPHLLKTTTTSPLQRVMKTCRKFIF